MRVRICTSHETTRDVLHLCSSLMLFLSNPASTYSATAHKKSNNVRTQQGVISKLLWQEACVIERAVVTHQYHHRNLWIDTTLFIKLEPTGDGPVIKTNVSAHKNAGEDLHFT